MNIVKTILIVISIVLVCRCTDDNSDMAKMTTDIDTNNLGASNGIISITIQANGSWILTSSDTWLIVAQTEGCNSATISVAYNTNQTSTEREASLTLKSGSATDILTFRQKAKAFIDSKSINSNDGTTARRLEIPSIDGTNMFRTYSSVVKGDTIIDFSLEWNPTKRHSHWVAYRFDNITAQKRWSRANWESTSWGGDPFQEDPTIPSQCRTTLSDYKGSGYDRGHLCPSGDRLYSKDANEHTYYLSNMSPQKNSFNSGIWLELENLTRSWGSSPTIVDTLYICKGGTISDNQIIKTVNDMPIPQYYFMAFVALKGSTYKGIAFWLEHDKKYSKPYDLKQYAMSIDELETKTGIDFFCNLPDVIEDDIEKSYFISDWTWEY